MSPSRSVWILAAVEVLLSTACSPASGPSALAHQAACRSGCRRCPVSPLLAAARAALEDQCRRRRCAPAERWSEPHRGTKYFDGHRERGTSAHALHDAVERCDLHVVKALIETRGMDPNAKDARGYTPLHLAYDCPRVYWQPPDLLGATILEYLLCRGADPNLPFAHGPEPRYTLLHRAAYDGNMVLVPMLVAAGAKVNVRDSRGFTPLHSAARCDPRLSCDDCSDPKRDDFFTRWKQGARPVIRYLLASRADLGARTLAGQSVLDVFATPCPQRSPTCDPSTLPASAWSVGTCRQSYLFVKRELERAERRFRKP